MSRSVQKLGDLLQGVLIALGGCGHDYSVQDHEPPVDSGPLHHHHRCVCGPRGPWVLCSWEGRRDARRIAESWSDGYQCECEPLAVKCPEMPSL